MRDTHTKAETQAEGEAGSMQGARCGTRSQVSRITPWAKGSRSTAEPPGLPNTTCSLFVHPLPALSCFHVLAIVNNAPMNVKVQISLSYPLSIFFEHMPRRGIAGSLPVILKMEKLRPRAGKKTNSGNMRHGSGRSRKRKAATLQGEQSERSELAQNAKQKSRGCATCWHHDLWRAGLTSRAHSHSLPQFRDILKMEMIGKSDSDSDGVDDLEGTVVSEISQRQRTAPLREPGGASPRRWALRSGPPPAATQWGAEPSGAWPTTRARSGLRSRRSPRGPRGRPPPPPRHGPGAVPGPAVPALPRRLHLRQEERYPLRAAPRGAAQSVAILLYLNRKYKVPDHWYPQDLQACARVDEYLAWQHTTLRRNCLRALWHKVMFPVFLGEPVSPEMLAATLAELDATLQLLEDKFLQNKAFLTGPHISLADLIAITELMHPVGAGCQVFEGRPKLAAWRQRVEAAVGKDLFQEAHEVILKAKDSPPADPIIKQKLMPRVLAMIQ
uniref:glutathione transferase n=3 Tax=Canis lupus TaxID=9612 RepID=A0A8C0T484_CANLF